jgi:hypothetical protein
MKKVKKLSRGGRFVDDGDSQKYVEDALDVIDTTPSPVAAGIGPMRGGPVSAGIGPVLSDRVGGFQDNMDRPEVTARPMGLMMPPPNRRMGLRGAVPGTYAEGPVGGMAAGMKKGGTVKKMAKGGSTSSASKRGDGCAIKGKTKGRFV